MNVPRNWHVAKFDEIFDGLQYGLTASADRTIGAEGPRFLRITDIQGHEVDWESVPTCDAEDDVLARYHLENDDIVFARTGSIEKTWRIRHCPPKAVFASYLIRGRLRDRRFAPWVEYFLRSQGYLSQVHSAAAGIGRANVNATSIAGFELPIAPVSEQHHIVAAIETHFSRLDATVASLTRAKANVKRARASVLKAAVEGRLVPTEAALSRAEGRDYEPAPVLLERILAERKAAWAASGTRGKYKEPVAPETEGLPVLPKGWCWATVEQLAVLVTDGDHNPPPRQATGIPHLTAKNVRNGQFNLLGCSFLSEAGFGQTRARYEAAAGDVIVTCVGTVGEVAIVPAGLVFSADRNLAGIRLVRAGMGKFVQANATAPRLRKWFRNASGSTAQPHLYLKDLRRAIVAVAPLAEQQRIVAEVDRRLSVLNVLDTTIDANLARSARLRQAVLKRAFEGRLVPPAASVA